MESSGEMPKRSSPAHAPLGLLCWLPAGLWAGGMAALVRGRAHRAASLRILHRPSDAERHLVDWDAGFALQQALPLCVLAGILAAWIASRACASSSRKTVRWLMAVTALVLLAAVSGPLAPDRLRARWYGSLTGDDLLLLLPMAMAGALALLLGTLRAARLAQEGHRATMLSGRLATLGAFVLGILIPANIARLRISHAPTFERRMALLDLLARPDLRTVLTSHPDRPPSVGVLTPALDQHSDSADKPALIMPPPCRVEVRLPDDAGVGVLRTAVALDRVLRNHLPTGVNHATVDFRLLRNGEEVWNTRIRSDRTVNSSWDPVAWTWRHAGGEAGIPVQGGDRLLFETSVPEGDPGRTLDPDLLAVGFGGLVIESRTQTRRGRAGKEAPNVVLLVMDTLRADRLSCYGYQKPTSPNLDSLAARGVRFTNAYSTSSWTWPSVASILTGLPADAHGVTSTDSCTLNLALTSLPEVLQARGYTTAAFSANPLISSERYFDQGFERFQSFGRRMHKSEDVVPAALRWLDGNAGVRFFLYLHLADTHTPHSPDPDQLARLGGVRPVDFHERGLEGLSSARLQSMRSQGVLPPLLPEHKAWVQDVYDASVATGDAWLGKLLERLEELGLDESTVVLVTSDHGEELLDRDRVGHGHGIHGELVRVPLVVAGPGIPSGVVQSAVVSNRHVAPTLAALTGADLPGMGDGRVLVPALEGPPAGPAVFQTARGYWRGRSYQPLYGIRRGDWVLHWADAEGGGELSLFDVASDPLEFDDLSTREGGVAQELFRELRTLRGDQREWAPAHVIGVGAGGMEALYAVGYGERQDTGEDGDGD